jgi:uncharacterized membrane protein HdeD (DUF308 family)
MEPVGGMHAIGSHRAGEARLQAMFDTGASHDLFYQQLRSEAGRLTWLGVALLVLGFIALVLPMFATLAVTFFVGAVLFLYGAATVFGSFSVRGTGPFFAELLLGLLAVAGGVFLMFRPGLGAAVLTMGLGILFMFQGAAEILLALEIRPNKGWGWMLASAIFSILLAVLILAGWPGSSSVALGLLIGVNFITSGAAYVALSNATKRALRST